MEKTFTATRLDEALAQVRAELGADAVILSSSHKKPRNGAPSVEVIAIAGREAEQIGLSLGSAATRRASQGRLAAALTRAGVPHSAARTLDDAVRRILGIDAPSLGQARNAITDALRTEMVFARPERTSRVVALVGPTGVGKTTTVAKLATLAALVERKRVGLVSLDPYRVGAVEQLERYANLIGIPLEIAHDTLTLSASLERLSQAELVLVDTAGRSPKDLAAIANLGETLHSARESIEIHLCLPAAMREAELQAVIDRHAILRPIKLIATKLDEAVNHGSIVGAHVNSGLPLSYFTTGQRVPEDLEIASPERLAALLCGEEIS